MFGFLRFVLVSLSSGLIFFGSGVFSALAEDALIHPGKVIEMGGKKRPLSVEIKAWPEAAQSGNDGECPLYGKAPLDSTTSSKKSGRFELKIGQSKPTFTTTYCANGYFPRTDKGIQNRVDGSPIIPHPAEMFPRSNMENYESVLKSKTASLLNDLAYLQNIDPKGFNNVMQNFAAEVGEYAGAQAELIIQVRDLISKW